MARLEEALGGAPTGGVETALGSTPETAREPYTTAAVHESVRGFRDEFVAAMDDDLNSARALGVLFEEIREVNRLLDAGEQAPLAAHHRNIAQLAAVLGVLRTPARAYVEAEKGRHLAASGVDVAEIERLIDERTAARKAREFSRADAIRDQLLERGIVLKDGAGGTTWSVV